MGDLVVFLFSASVREGKDNAEGKLIQKEERNTGSVKMEVYWYYIKAIGVGLFALVMLLFVGQNGLSIATNFWLSEWSEAGNNITNATEVSRTSKLKNYR